MAHILTTHVIRFICLIYCLHSCLSRSVRRDHRVADTVDYSRSRVIRVMPTRLEQLEYLRYLDQIHHDNIRFWQSPTRLGKTVDIQVHESDVPHLTQELAALGLRSRTVIGDIGHKLDSDRIQEFSALGVGNNPFFSNFHRYSEIVKFVKKKVKSSKRLASLKIIGRSAEKRPILLVTLSTDANSEANNKTVIYLDGGTHAREWAGITATLFILDQLIDDFKRGDPLVTSLLQQFDFLIVPLVNPDGYEWSYTKDRMWRKNRSPNKNTDCVGTDLNRNYRFHWGEEGSSHEPCREDYCGPSPQSEPESRTIAKLIMKNKHRMLMYITLHAYGQLYLYPWGVSKEDSPNVKELKRVANLGNKALYKVHKTKYTVGTPGQILYWAHGVAKIPYVYCLELRDNDKTGSYGFLLPKKEIIPVGEETYAAFTAMVKAIVNTKRKGLSNVSYQLN